MQTGWNLPGRLAVNRDVQDLLRDYWFNPVAVNSVHIIKAMFESLNDINNPDAAWHEDATYCQSCLELFINDRLYSWLVAQLVKGAFLF